MKRSTTILFLFFVATCFAGVGDELAKTKEESIRSWSGIRDAILAIGPSATNDLAHAAADENLDWRERFMANVCLERLVQPDVRDAFFANPLKDDPERNQNRIYTAAGYAFEDIPLFERRLVEKGYWFGALELFAMMLPEDHVDPLWKLVGPTIFKQAPQCIRRTAAAISETYSMEYIATKSIVASDFPCWLEQYVMDGTYPEGNDTFLQVLATYPDCDFLPLQYTVEHSTDHALLESLIPCFSNRPQKVSMLRRRIDRLRESTVVEPESHPAFDPDSGQAEREEKSVPVDEESPASESGPNGKQHPRSYWVFSSIVLAVVLAVFLFFFRRSTD